MPEALTKTIKEKVAPVVTSKATPDAPILLHFRAIIQKEEDISKLFLQYRAEKKSVEWLRDMVATRITVYADEKYSFATIVEACLYLADEYNQLGDGYFMVSTETGKVQAVVTEDDLYDPPEVARYSGDMVQPLKRLKPSTEVVLTTYTHEKGREKEILDKLVARGHPIQCLKMATRGGRKQIVRDLEVINPHELMARSGGTTGRFLQHVTLSTKDPEGEFDAILEGTLNHRSMLHVQDPLAMNHSHNQLGTLRGTIPQGWIRDLCRTLSEKAYADIRAMARDIDELEEASFGGAQLWIAEPDVLRAILRISPRLQAVPVEGVDLIGLRGNIGTLVLPEEFEVQSQERFNRWEVLSNIPYKLFVNWKEVRVMPIAGIAHEPIVDL